MAQVPLLHAMLLITLLGLSSGIYNPDIWLVPGETAVFQPSTTLFSSISWTFSNVTIVDKNFTDPEYTDRITLFSNGTLQLRIVTHEDQGPYTATITSAAGHTHSSTSHLSVYEQVHSVVLVTLTPPGPLIEFRSFANITCAAGGGTGLVYTWYNDSAVMSTTAQDLSIARLTRYDSGPFQCRVTNPINSVLSPSRYLSISYGPDITNLTTDPIPTNGVFYEGSAVTIYCNVISSPTAVITWFHNGEPVEFSSDEELFFEYLDTNDSGDYMCQAYNPITLVYAVSQPFVISVIKDVPVEGGLSVGAIVGITLGCIGVVVVAVSIFCCVRKK
ncbi:unnamed protein product [Knipowitschia caucasica]